MLDKYSRRKIKDGQGGHKNGKFSPPEGQETDIEKLKLRQNELLKIQLKVQESLSLIENKLTIVNSTTNKKNEICFDSPEANKCMTSRFKSPNFVFKSCNTTSSGVNVNNYKKKPGLKKFKFSNKRIKERKSVSSAYETDSNYSNTR